MRVIYISLFIIGLHITAFAQSEQLLDSVAIRFNEIESLQKGGNLEKALIELEDLRWMLKREKAYIKPKHLTVALNVYNASLDQPGAAKFLNDIQTSVNTITDNEARVGLMNELIRVFEARGSADKALLLQRQLTSDSLKLQTSQMEVRMDSVRRSIDSLLVVREQEAAAQTQYFQVKRERAWLLGAMAGLALLALLGTQFYQRRKFDARMEDKERELSHLRGYLNAPLTMVPEQPQSQPIAQPVYTPTPEPVADQQHFEQPNLPAKTTHSHIPSQINGGTSGQFYQPKYLALLVEPNRQVAMYLKSLIGPEYEVEITESAPESVEFAKTRIPDIIITDTNLLNGSSGIDLARMMKQDVRTNHVPIALITAATGHMAEQELFRASADLVIPRPLLDDDLDSSLKAVFKRRADVHHDYTRILQLWFTKSKEEPQDPFLLTLMNHVERNIPDVTFSPADLARTMQYEKQVFNRKVHALTGRDTQDIIRILRLEKAKFLLENRVAPVQVVAGLVGFDNQGAFSRAFKEHFGDTNILLLN